MRRWLLKEFGDLLVPVETQDVSVSHRFSQERLKVRSKIKATDYNVCLRVRERERERWVTIRLKEITSEKKRERESRKERRRHAVFQTFLSSKEMP